MLKQQWKRVLVLEDDIVAPDKTCRRFRKHWPNYGRLGTDCIGYLKHEQVTTGLQDKAVL